MNEDIGLKEWKLHFQKLVGGQEESRETNTSKEEEAETVVAYRI